MFNLKSIFNKKDNKQEQKKEESINLYLLVTTRPISGGFSMSFPTIDTMQSTLDQLSRLSTLTSKNPNYVYKPIGIIYEAEAK